MSYKNKILLVFCVSGLCISPLNVRPATITVTNTDDSGPGSLWQALADANDGDTITFAVIGTIGLTSGELLLDKSITISGPGSDILAVSGNGESRVFHIGSGKSVSVSGLTVTNGYGGGIFNDNGTLTLENCTVAGNFGDTGGGVLNEQATLIVNNCIVDDNAAYLGGGIYNADVSAILTVIATSVAGNFADQEGGGISNEGGTVTIINSAVNENFAPDGPLPTGGGIFNAGQMQIDSSVIDDNFVAESGGGIANNATMVITDSSVTNNHAGTNFEGSGLGGGIFNSGTMEITNSLIAFNDATSKNGGSGGGISSNGSLEISNSTITNNVANLGGGGIGNSGPLRITNSTINGNGNGGIYTSGMEIGNTILNNNSGTNIDGTATSLGYNISTDDGGGNLTGTGDQINTDPLLGPLQANGGPTQTHALLPGSPAIDTGDPSFTPPPWYDQRGTDFWRLRNGRIDIGSFEVQTGAKVTPTPNAYAQACSNAEIAPDSASSTNAALKKIVISHL